jgi:hypothetical protein
LQTQRVFLFFLDKINFELYNKKRGESMTKKYIKLYFKRIAPFFIFFSAFDIFLWIATFNSYEDKVLYIIEGIIFTLFIELFFIIRTLFILRFKRMISRQEMVYSIKIDNDTEYKEIAYGICTSKNWLVFAGNMAFYKRNIAKISYKEYGRGSKATCIVTITTKNSKKYKIFLPWKTTITKIRTWYKQ